MKRFKLIPFGDNQVAIVFERMDAELFSTTLTLVRGFPERTFDRPSQSWVISTSQKNIEYLRRTFSEDEFEIETDRIPKKTDIIPAEKMMWLYMFDKGAEVSLDGYTPKLEPFRHQAVGLRYLHQCEYFGLLWEMGTGKSKVLADEFAWQVREGNRINALIICPNNLRKNWLNELEKNIPEDIDYYAARLRTQASAVRQLRKGLEYDVPLKVWICGVDRLRQNLEWLKMMNFDICVLDESHRIKDPRTKRSKAIIELAPTCKRRFILTGTPTGNLPSDLFQQFEFLKPGCLGSDNYNNFQYRFDSIKLAGSLERITSHPRMHELRERMSRISLIVRKKDCLDLPEKTYSVRTIEMTARQREVYDQMAEFLMAELQVESGNLEATHAPVIIVQLLRLAQICSGFIKNMDKYEVPIPGPNPKIEETKEIIEELQPHERFIIWCRFTHDVHAVSDLLRKMGITHGIINGETSDKMREHYVESFNQSYGIRCIIGEPGSGGEGLTLIGTKDRPCTTCIRFSHDFSIIKREQAEDRCHRIGMYNPVHYIDLCCEESIDESILDILNRKRDLGRAVKDVESIREMIKGHKDDD